MYMRILLYSYIHFIYSLHDSCSQYRGGVLRQDNLYPQNIKNPKNIPPNDPYENGSHF